MALCSPASTVSTVDFAPEERQRTVELLNKIDDLKTDVAFLDRELGWDAAKSESAHDAARNARVSRAARAAMGSSAGGSAGRGAPRLTHIAPEEMACVWWA